MERSDSDDALRYRRLGGGPERRCRPARASNLLGEGWKWRPNAEPSRAARAGSCPNRRPMWSAPGSRARISVTTCSNASSRETSSSRPSIMSRAPSTSSCRGAPRHVCSGMPTASGSACTSCRTVSSGRSGCSSPGPWSATASSGMRRVRHLVRARARHGARRQALLLHALPDQGLPQAAGRGGAPAQRGAIARGHRPRAGERSRHCARLDRAQAWLGRLAPERDRIARAGGRVRAHSNGLHELDRCLAGANTLAPDLMTADQRLTEVGAILAAGSCACASGNRRARCPARRRIAWTSRPTEACMRPHGSGDRSRR